jgi:Holliday junction resolvase RusA-like endonuclease
MEATSTEFRIEIPGSPVAWQRPRAAPSASGKPIFFEAAKVKTWRQTIRLIAQEAMKDRPMLGGTPKNKIPLIAIINFYVPRPGRLYRKKDPETIIPMASRPDVENVYKGIADALQGIVYYDDALIASAHINKYYHEKAGKPRTTVEIIEVRDTEAIK